MRSWFNGCSRSAATSLPSTSIVGKKTSAWILPLWSFCTPSSMLLKVEMPENLMPLSAYCCTNWLITYFHM